MNNKAWTLHLTSLIALIQGVFSVKPYLIYLGSYYSIKLYPTK